MSEERGEGSTADRPLLRVVRGSATAEEIAALLAVVAAAGAQQEPATASASTSRWADKARLVRAPLRSGPGAWRSSGRPG